MHCQLAAGGGRIFLTGGEVPEGYGWACWKGRFDEWLGALFPIRT